MTRLSAAFVNLCKLLFPLPLSILCKSGGAREVSGAPLCRFVCFVVNGLAHHKGHNGLRRRATHRADVTVVRVGGYLRYGSICLNAGSPDDRSSSYIII